LAHVLFYGLDQVSKMSKQLKVEENLEGQLVNLALQDQDIEVKPIDQHSGAGADVAQQSSSKVSLIFQNFDFNWFTLEFIYGS
jgi:hypothetical protein